MGLTPQQFRPHWATTLLLLSALLCAQMASAAAPTEWELIEDLDDIAVWQKTTPGTSLVTFRAKGIIDADIFSVFAVLYDADNKTELLNQCSQYTLLEYLRPDAFVAYSRLKSPFFLISGRDVIFKTDVQFEPAKQRIVAAFFKADDSLVEPPPGVVRIAELTGQWIIQPTKEGQTQVTYEARVDPSGMVPHWVVNRVSKWLPHRTIQNMRKEVTRVEAYQKSRLLVKYLFDFEGLMPTDHSVLKRIPEEQARFEQTLKTLKKSQPLQPGTTGPQALAH